MAITIELPAELERELRARTPDLDTYAKVVVGLSFYRRHLLTVAQLAAFFGSAASPEDDALVTGGASIDADEFRFHDGDVARYEALAQKSDEGTLTAAEALEIRAFVELDTSLSLLRVRNLRRQTDAA